MRTVARTVELAALAAMLALALPCAALGQRMETRFDAGIDAGMDARIRAEPESESAVVEIAKWSAGGLALAAGAWAFVMQHDAEDRLEELERFCADSPLLCADVTPDGEYRDAALEARYQGIRTDYRNSRWLLLGAHALAATSVVLFIIDLPRNSTPDNVPYEPPALRLLPRMDGGVEASFRYPVSNIFTRSP